jgi:hypothetical protein
MTELARAQGLADRLAKVLRDEIAAVGQGHLGDIAVLAQEKAALLEEIETVFAGGAALFAGADRLRSERLRVRLAEVQDLVAQDLTLLERMTRATGAIAAEIARVRDRHGLAGLYGPDGEKRQSPVAKPQRIDRSL